VPSEVVVELESLSKLFKDNGTVAPDEIDRHLNKIAFQLTKKLRIDGGNMLSNCMSFIGLALFFTSVFPAVPFLILALSYLLKILLVAYQDFAKPPS